MGITTITLAYRFPQHLSSIQVRKGAHELHSPAALEREKTLPK